MAGNRATGEDNWIAEEKVAGKSSRGRKREWKSNREFWQREWLVFTGRAQSIRQFGADETIQPEGVLPLHHPEREQSDNNAGIPGLPHWSLSLILNPLPPSYLAAKSTRDLLQPHDTSSLILHKFPTPYSSFLASNSTVSRHLSLAPSEPPKLYLISSKL